MALMKDSLTPRRVKRAIALLLCLVLVLTLFYWSLNKMKSTDNAAKPKVNEPNRKQVGMHRDLDIMSQRWPEFTPVPSVDCKSKPQSEYPFCNSSLKPEDRASDLISRLNESEIIAQTSSIAPGITRLGIKDYNWRSNCLHGWSYGGGHWYKGLYWTVFPASIGLGATFNTDLVKAVGQVTADEGRALHNLMLVYFNGSSTEAAGLNCFSPNVNLMRDPRWGRIMETYGEDPYLISQIGSAYTKGLQEGNDPKYLKIGACAKHYAVHSGPEELRAVFSANASLHDLFDTFLPAFKSQVFAANVSQMMPAYSGMRCKYEPDGAPDAANPYLLRTVLREQFQAANISIISDNYGVEEVQSTHKFVPTLELAAAVCMNATTDLDLGHDEVYPKYLPDGLKDKVVNIETVKAAVWRSFLLRFRLGDFDPPSLVPYQLINGSHLNTPANQQLNLQAARESIVLLKNTGDILPLSPDAKSKIAVIGPNSNATQVLLSNYEGIPLRIVSVLEGIQSTVQGSTVSWAIGCDTVKCPDTSKFQDAINVASNADYVIMVMGLDTSVESEGHDRAETTCEQTPQDNLALPGCQTELVDTILKHNSKVILVLLNGGPISIPTLYNNDGILGLLEVFYPGALGGTAVADVLFGNYNPGGRMPMTVYDSTKDVPPSINYNMTFPPGRTYRYYMGTPLIPFGYGLSYTQFKYTKVAISSASIKPCESVIVSVALQNVGKLAGDEVIQVYVVPPTISGKYFIPKIQILGFKRVHLEPAASNETDFDLNPYLLSLVDEDGERYLFPGEYTVQVDGGNERFTWNFTITGDVTSIKKCSGSPKCLAC